MNDSISAPFIRYPIATSLLMAGILFVGLIAFPLLPVAPLPQVDFPTIQVSASLPGASPETMASSVAQPLERRMAQIPGIAPIGKPSAVPRSHGRHDLRKSWRVIQRPPTGVIASGPCRSRDATHSASPTAKTPTANVTTSMPSPSTGAPNV